MNKAIPLASLCLTSGNSDILQAYLALTQRLMSAIVKDTVAKTCAGEQQAAVAAQLSSASSNRLG
jgi:hypothetical protein